MKSLLGIVLIIKTGKSLQRVYEMQAELDELRSNLVPLSLSFCLPDDVSVSIYLARFMYISGSLSESVVWSLKNIRTWHWAEILPCR
jgi:Kef-type K+ transport system membrane component KefB